MALPLAFTKGNISGQVLYGLAITQCYQGEYTAALLNASKAQTLAKMSGYLYLQACALVLEGTKLSGLKSEYVEAQNMRAQILDIVKDSNPYMYCDIIGADIELREGNMSIAMSYLQKCLHPLRGDSAEYISWSLERLANGNHWTAADWDSCWATVYFVHSLKLKRRLDIHKALQYLGSMFLSQGEEDTAHNLFMVALDGFTQMDVHRSRAECMLQLGDIA
ncbi:hypothetical protein K438DRAFT_2114159 [Mycena galopus ATCC 62051]|nr:hypothetical protein K438DRAFT_2114159 [Mycena galopus ATCC 62051]